MREIILKKYENQPWFWSKTLQKSVLIFYKITIQNFFYLCQICLEVTYKLVYNPIPINVPLTRFYQIIKKNTVFCSFLALVCKITLFYDQIPNKHAFMVEIYAREMIFLNQPYFGLTSTNQFYCLQIQGFNNLYNTSVYFDTTCIPLQWNIC